MARRQAWGQWGRPLRRDRAVAERPDGPLQAVTSVGRRYQARHRTAPQMPEWLRAEPVEALSFDRRATPLRQEGQCFEKLDTNEDGQVDGSDVIKFQPQRPSRGAMSGSGKVDFGAGASRRQRCRRDGPVGVAADAIPRQGTRQSITLMGPEAAGGFRRRAALLVRHDASATLLLWACPPRKVKFAGWGPAPKSAPSRSLS